MSAPPLSAETASYNPESWSSRNDMTAELFVHLMRKFYDKEWMTGTGGAMGALTREGQLLLSPSAVQKDFLNVNDLYICPDPVSIEMLATSGICDPQRLPPTSCARLFAYFVVNKGHGCVIHTHSKFSNLLTKLTIGNEIRIKDEEYLKGILNLSTGEHFRNTAELAIPIIENEESESKLFVPVTRAVEQYPASPAVLVRNHGLFVFGPTWQQTKVMLECLEHLFEILFAARTIPAERAPLTAY